MEGMLARLPARMLAEWMAFDQVEPISLGWRGDVQAGIVASVLANVYRDPKRKREPYEAEDFMPGWGLIRKEPEPEDVWRKVKMWAERYKN